MSRAALYRLFRSEPRRLLSTTTPSGFSAFRARSSPQYPTAKPNLTSPVLFPSTQIRRASNSATAAAHDAAKISLGPQKLTQKEADSKTDITYQGPISPVITKVKLLSLSTCCLSISLGPVITFMTSSQTNVVLKSVVAATVIFFSASTTGCLHWFVSPYIHKLRWQPGSDSFEVVKLSWLARPFTRTVKFADIRYADTNRPYVTFKANEEFYYVDAEHCHNKTLLAKLTPKEPSHG